MQRTDSTTATRAAFRTWLLDAASASAARYVALAVGDSTLPLYADLPCPHAAWDSKRIVPLDELVPAPRDPSRSFSSRLTRALPSGLRDLLDPISASDPEDEAARIERAIDTDGLAACVLGLGPDGHIAFNQPGSDAGTLTRVVEIAPDNLARLGDVAPASRAITLGVGTILRAEHIALIVGGQGKDDALWRALHGPEGADSPVSWLRRHADVTVFSFEEVAR